MCNQNIIARAEGVEDANLNVIDTRPHFYINVEPKNYNREYGCDWLKSEYINPDKNLELASGTRSKAAISTTIAQLRTVYQSEELYVGLGYSFYYPMWFTFLANNREYQLKLKTEKLMATNIPNSTLIEFRCTSPNIEINQRKLNNPANYLRESWRNEKDIKIRCVGELNSVTTIDMYAVLSDGTLPYKVGCMKLETNNNIKNVELHFVHLIFSNNCNSRLNGKYDKTGNNSLQNILNNKSLNQLLISCLVNNINSPQIIDLRSTPAGQAIINTYDLTKPVKTIYRDNDGVTYSENQTSASAASYECATNQIDATNINQFREAINTYVQSQIPWFNNRLNDLDNNRLKIIILINISVQETHGTTFADRFGRGFTAGEAMIGGTRTPIYCDRLNTKDKFSKTVIHEIGHLLGLEHSFDHGTVNFHQGYTDFFMDYEYDALGNSNGSVISNKVRFSKTEWDSIN